MMITNEVPEGEVKALGGRASEVTHANAVQIETRKDEGAAEVGFVTVGATPVPLKMMLGKTA